MPSVGDEKTAEEDTHCPPRPQSSLSQPPQPPTPSQKTIHVYPAQQPLIKSKRHQVKNACTNCRKVCKKCDDARPCYRCVKYGISDNCVDSQRKRRRTGKRGPYKRKGRAGNNVDPDVVKLEEPVLLAPAASPSQPPHAEPWNIPGYCPPYGYPQGFYMYNHYPPMASQQVGSVHACMPVTQPHFLTNHPQYQSYPYPAHGPKCHACPPEAYYTTVFSSVSYPEIGQLPEGSGMIAPDQL